MNSKLSDVRFPPTVHLIFFKYALFKISFVILKIFSELTSYIWREDDKSVLPITICVIGNDFLLIASIIFSMFSYPSLLSILIAKFVSSFKSLKSLENFW